MSSSVFGTVGIVGGARFLPEAMRRDACLPRVGGLPYVVSLVKGEPRNLRAGFALDWLAA
jgi:hypothetical protein